MMIIDTLSLFIIVIAGVIVTPRLLLCLTTIKKLINNFRKINQFGVSNKHKDKKYYLFSINKYFLENLL